MSCIEMLSQWLLFDAHYFQLCLCVFIQSQDFVVPHWILHRLPLVEG